MKNSFNVSLNQQIIYTYTSKPSPARLRRYLDEMDDDMQQGIFLGDERVSSPSEFQRIQYVAVKLFFAIEDKDFNLAEVMSAYLMNRSKQLSKINIEQADDVFNLNLM